ncbi:hypothetical protein Bhyg_09402 [Pseudolycoriella hygida]|uniref:Kringle domain-containing protein n=1 Tax=Pseudolycoriella hygida TaxID=35572 RepID=A0A9Q0N6E4_9DIPT|nr:hypothetical protein Bhyg_09402 [Pseudolycoriella hygida]
MYSSCIFVSLCLIFFIQIDQTLAARPCRPSTCRYDNEEFAVDENRPQNTCEYYGCYNQFVCPGTSKTGECYCKKGYARIFANGPCISIDHPWCKKRAPPTPEDCQKRENEVYNEYLGYRMCENTCENYERNCGTINTLVATWKPWCDCKEGYSRLPDGKCVAVTDPRCYNLYKPSVAQCKLRGEVYRVGQICESIPSCQYPDGPPFICMAIGPMERCYCRDGYLRNSKGVCVPKAECEPPQNDQGLKPVPLIH